MYKNINRIIEVKSEKIKKLPRLPLIIHWLSSSHMEESLTILDRKVGYLLNNFSKGGEGKLNQWLFSDDVNFCTLTAERYILDYLRSKNTNIEDNLSPKGVDGSLSIADKKVGIEITTLNAFVADWIFSERLTQSISSIGFLSDKTIRVKYSISRLLKEYRKSTLDEYIHQVGAGIADNNTCLLQDANVYMEIEHRWKGCITWEIVDEDESHCISNLTKDLYDKITTSKNRQLNKFDKNIIFVGVNNISSPNWAIPLIFSEIGKGGFSYTHQISYINSFWQKSLQHHKNLIGICYFCYSLNREGPFYPLRMFWRDDSEQVPVNLN